MTNRIFDKTESLPLSGHMLVSTNRGEDARLRETVCLILQHGSDGSTGLVLNRELGDDFDSLLHHLSPTPSKRIGHIHFGGPASGPIVALHNHEHLAEAWAGAGVYLAARLDKLQAALEIESGEVRILVGHLQWAAGALEKELYAGQWMPLPATPELVFAPNEEMWLRSIRAVGDRFITLISGAQPIANAQWN